MYKALLSFTTNNYDVRKNQILPNDFTTQDEIQEFLNIGYIEVYDGAIEITENGTYNVEDYETADVNVSGGSANLQTKNVAITSNGSSSVTPDTGYDGLEEVNITTNVTPTNQSKTLTITENTTTTITPDTGYDGLSSVEVTTNVSGGGGSVAMPDGVKFGQMVSTATNMDWLANVDTSALTDAQQMFYNYTNIISVGNFDTSNVTTFYQCFYGCSGLVVAPTLDTSSATTTQGMFQGCSNLTTLPVYNLSNVRISGASSMFDSQVTQLTNQSLDNLLQSCISGTQISSTYKSLRRMFGFADMSAYYPATTIQSLPHYQDFVNAGWSIDW